MLKEEMLKHNFGSSQVCEINLEIQSKVHQVGINFFNKYLLRNYILFRKSRHLVQWPQNWKRSAFIPIPKKGTAKECSNYHTSHSSHMLAE